jgi:exodeoxyribonuclease V alpha subunit
MMLQPGHNWSGFVFIKSIRSKNKRGFGGAIFTGRRVEREGTIAVSDRPLVFIAQYKVLLAEDWLDVGQYWHISGLVKNQEIIVDGFRLVEMAVTISEMWPVVETGEMVRHSLASNRMFHKIGQRKADGLWEKYGRDLYGILERGDIEPLCAGGVGESAASNLVNDWPKYTSGRFRALLAQHEIPKEAIDLFMTMYGRNADERLREDPYRLLSYSAGWLGVDRLARLSCQIPEHDSRQLVGAVEEAMYRLLARGHTAASTDMVKKVLSVMLGSTDLANTAIQIGMGGQSFIRNIGDGLHQVPGPYVMERFLAERLVSMTKMSDRNNQHDLSSVLDSTVEILIDQFENNEQQQVGRNFRLNTCQRKAIQNSLDNRVSIICGGIGTGKTLTVRCLSWILGKLGYVCVRLTLGCDDAKRKAAEAGDVAYPLFKFISGELNVQECIKPGAYVVIEEASMVDLQTYYRLLSLLPESSQLVFVGDIYKSPPVGPGIVFRVLADKIQTIPSTELVEVFERDNAKEIARFACKVRTNLFEEIPLPGIRFENCGEQVIPERLLALYREYLESPQIITPFMACPLAGVTEINRRCREASNPAGRPLLWWDTKEEMPVATGFHEGDRVIFKRDDWKRGIVKGSLGKIIRIHGDMVGRPDRGEMVVATALVGNEEYSIRVEDIWGKKPIFEHSYAMTTCTAIADKFPRILIPMRESASRYFDSEWLYTVLACASGEVVFVGNIGALKEAIKKTAKRPQRITGLRAAFHRATEGFSYPKKPGLG